MTSYYSEVETCPHCNEPIAPGDTSGPIITRIGADGRVDCPRLHLECSMRSVIGSVGHLLGKCSCPGGTGEMDDPPGMTKREAAKAAYELWRSGSTRVDRRHTN